MTTFAPMEHQSRAIPEMVRGNYFLSWDPGTGKTFPACVAAAWVDGQTLAIVPAHLRDQWKANFKEHTPWRSCVILDKVNEKIPDSVLYGVDIIIVSYEYVSTLPRWKQLRRKKWAVIVLDEAHYLMNLEAARTRAVIGSKPLTDPTGLVFAAKNVWPLTGTPFTFPNQIYPILAALFPDALRRPKKNGPGLMTMREWENEFCQFAPDPKGFGDKLVGAKNIPDLRHRLEPFLDKVRISDITDVDLMVDEIPIRGTLSKFLKGLDPEILEQYEALTEILTDDAIPDTEKLAALDESGLVMAQLRHHIAVAKIEPTAEIIKNELASGQKKIILFGWHKEPLKALAKKLKAPLISGDSTKRTKAEALEAFLYDKDPVLVGQISAIGTGTDGLQDVCHRSLFMEASWAHRENKQCLHRTYRKGQKLPCHTSFITLLGSVDEYVQKILRRNAEIVKKSLD